MNIDTLKRLLPFLALIVLLTPIIIASFLDIEQEKMQEFIRQHERIDGEFERLAEEKNYLMGKFDPEGRPDFVLIPIEYTIDQMQDYKLYLQKETFEAFLRMREEALKDNIELKIASGTRSFISQKDLWENQWTGLIAVRGENLFMSFPNEEERFNKILEYIAVPGTSRHHWGSDIDLNGANIKYFHSKKGQREYEWLKENASRFGFCQTYDSKGLHRSTGYNEEKWHWSYIPLAKNFAQRYVDLIREHNIKGFLGDQYVLNQDLVNDFVLNINPKCI